MEDRTGILGNKKPEATVHQPRAIHAEQLRAGQVRLSDRPVPIQAKIARRRKIVEVGVTFQRLLPLCPRLLELLVLYLQLELVNLQFLNKPMRVMRRSLSFGLRVLSLLHLA